MHVTTANGCVLLHRAIRNQIKWCILNVGMVTIVGLTSEQQIRIFNSIAPLAPRPTRNPLHITCDNCLSAQIPLSDTYAACVCVCLQLYT